MALGSGTILDSVSNCSKPADSCWDFVSDFFEVMNTIMHTAKLVSITPDTEKGIVYMARVSNPANQNNDDTAPKLIRYLVKHKHWSPFEMAHMAVEINTSRAIAAQILRHRSFSFQEFSQRYSSVEDLAPLQLPMLRRQDTKNKQASHDDLNPALVEKMEEEIELHYDNAQRLYLKLLGNGVAKECAREVLPLGTPTRLYMAGSIRSWIHYLDVRCGIETQLEHRMVANAIKDIFRGSLPSIYEAVFSSEK
jgi:thymidylate synthase (FAD)